MKNLNKSEEDKITLLEKENTKNYINSRNINVKDNEDKDNDKENENENLITENNFNMTNLKYVNYYPNSKNEIIDLLSNKLDFWFFLGNIFFIFCTLSIIYCKKFNLEGDIFSTVISMGSLSK